MKNVFMDTNGYVEGLNAWNVDDLIEKYEGYDYIKVDGVAYHLPFSVYESIQNNWIHNEDGLIELQDDAYRLETMKDFLERMEDYEGMKLF